ncbi:MAG: hypothetical protein KGN36_10540 [Acidobacteriota bacterium]|nr:hypothetical protein [Acidobacteriota bacterium]
MKTPLITVALFTTSLAAQQIDTSNFSSGRTGASMADRAESPAERRDFLAIAGAAGPAEMRRLADAFVAQYPRSWLLAAAWQMSAGASLDLKDYPRALAAGRSSLRLLPENPLLLVAVAGIEAAADDKRQSLRDAEDALLYLSVSAAPAAFGAKQWEESRTYLQAVARRLIAQSGARNLPPWVAPPPSDAGPRLRYAGSEACAACHRAAYDSWRATGMGAMLRPIADTAPLADFSRESEFTDPVSGAKVRTGGGRHPYFEFSAPAGVRRFPVAYTIGSKWQQAYAMRLPDGRIYVFPIQFNLLEKRWLNYWATLDPPGSERTQVARFAELSPATSYQRNCAVCHTSQLRLRRLSDTTFQDAVFREPGIDCEMCHGPSASHAAAMRAGTDATAAGAAPPFRFARLDHWRATMICGQCHRQSALRDLGPDGEMNYSPDPPYFSWLLSQPPAEFGTRAFYKDGRFRETTFIGEAFQRSACFRRGTAQCASCHSPHPAGARGNRTSLKFADHPDQMCLQCHSAYIPRIASHTHHAANSPGSRCVACHMPPIMSSLLFRAASHQIEIPSADATLRFGQEESPNACLLCHKDRGAAWAADSLRQWATAP